MSRSKFLFSEIANCGVVASPCLKSFRKHHPNLEITIYGTPRDFEQLEVKDGMELVDLNLTDWGREVLQGYSTAGHAGTGKLWSHIIKTKDVDIICHLDSDTILFAPLLQEILDLSEDYDLIGGRKLYVDNLAYKTGMQGIHPVVSTSSFAYYKRPLEKFDQSTLCQAVLGQNVFNAPHRIIDTFDPISFYLLSQGARIKHLHVDDVGGVDELGSRDNIWGKYNGGNTGNLIEYGNKIAHFSSAGSGCNFYYNPSARPGVSQSYVNYALDRFALFMKIFKNEDIGIDVSKYAYLYEDMSIWNR